MNRYVALLRGINVNGVTIKSKELAQLFTDLGFTQVRTVLATGNVDFVSDTSQSAKLKSEIEKALSQRFGYDAWIVLVQHDLLSKIIEGYPFEEDSEHHAYVIFASTKEAQEELLIGFDNQDVSDEQVSEGKGVVYWRCLKGSTLKTNFSKHLAKAKFKPTTTNRNINTLRKLL